MFGEVLEFQVIMKIAQRKSLEQQRALGFFYEQCHLAYHDKKGS
jgi:hypothetical protein